MRALLALSVLLVAAPAAAEPPATEPTPPAPAAPEPERGPWDGAAHNSIEVGVGMLALPAADVCTSPGQCEPGEASIAINAQNLGRVGDFGFGGGITWGFGLAGGEAVAPGDEEGALGREHSRSYFLIEGQFRYYPPRLRAWEWWVGTTLGGVIVNDSWSTIADREPYADTAFVGPRSVTLATEGLAAGIGIGGHWRFYEQWFVGSHLRYANWFLPSEPELTPVNDSASLAGRIDVIDFGLAGGVLLWL